MDILSSLNAVSLHLIKPVTKRMFEYCSRDTKLPILTNEILISKLFNHSQPQIRKFGVHTLLGIENLETSISDGVLKRLRPEYLGGRFLAMIDDSFFYRSKRGVVFKKTMHKFLSQYFDTFREKNETEMFHTFANEFLRSCSKCESGPCLQTLFAFLSRSNAICGVRVEKKTLMFLSDFIKGISSSHGSDFILARNQDLSRILRQCSCSKTLIEEFSSVLASLDDDIFMDDVNEFRTWVSSKCEWYVLYKSLDNLSNHRHSQTQVRNGDRKISREVSLFRRR